MAMMFIAARRANGPRRQSEIKTNRLNSRRAYAPNVALYATTTFSPFGGLIVHRNECYTIVQRQTARAALTLP